MTYYPAGHDVVLFGGYGEIGVAPWSFYQDTWSFVNNRWTEVISNTSCTVSTCPSPRAGAMLANYGPDNALLLFGGYIYSSSITYIPYNDTWLYSGGTWKNITATAGPAPSARFESSMVWDPYDNDVLLFGGSLASGTTLGDTWTFNGTWHNITASLSQAPVSRAGASITDSPSGWILLFGGEHNGVVLIDPNCGESTVAWWFFGGKWQYLGEPVCIAGHAGPSLLANATYPPCGRVDAALGWSPKNSRFVLYGGWGPTAQNTTSCGGFYGFLNDTWTYANPPGSGFVWYNVTDAGDPSAREQMGYASDFTDGYFEIFGGYNGTDGGLNETWRFYEVVHAKLTGPTNIDTSGSLTFLVPFTVTGFGGSGNLSYTFHLKGLKNSNTLSGTGCQNLTNGASISLPYDGVAQERCSPVPTSYNLYRLTVNVQDDENLSDQANASWTFTVSPPEKMAIYSQYTGYFYSGIPFPNKFGVLAEVASQPAVNLSATLGGVPLSFSPRSGHAIWWDASVDMNTVAVGPQVLRATANFAGNWTLNATYNVTVVDTPDWLISVIEYPQVTQTITPKGSGPYNGSFSISEAFSWSLDKALGFNIELPFVKGNVSLVPAIKVSLTATSSGNLTLSGSLSLTPPSIDLGVAKIGISVALSLKGSFTLGIVSGDITGVTWKSAVASITITGKFGASVPIYGFDILGVKVGFTLEVEVDPSVTLGMILAPTTPGFDEFIQGIQVKIQQFVGSISLPLSLSVSFGIGIASIAIGGKVSVALNLATSTGLYISAGWINGTIFISASFLWWSDDWDLASGTIYNWTNPAPPAHASPQSIAPGALPTYNNGSNTSWAFHSRYYATASYDRNVWIASSSAGPAITDIYPYTSLTAAAGPNGTYLFYTNDNVSLPVQGGLGISGLVLNSTSNALSHVPSPVDPGYLAASPTATHLSDGSLYVLWDALPTSEETISSPVNLTLIGLHGARYFPDNHTWGPVHAYTSSGLAQSYLVDATGRVPVVVAIVSPSYLLGTTTAERLLEYNLTSGGLIANTSVSGVAELEGIRGPLGAAIVRGVDGNFSEITLATGAAQSLPALGPAGSLLASASFVQGSPSTAALLYRGSSGSLLVLYDLAASRTVGTLALGQDAAEAEAIAGVGSIYAFVRTTHGVEGWTETAGAFANLTNLTETGVADYSVVQLGSGILVLSLTDSGNSSAPTVDLNMAEISASIVPVPGGSSPSRSSSGSSSPNSSTYELYLGIAAGAVVVLLAVVAIMTRGRPPVVGRVPAGAEGTSPPGSPPSPPAPSSSPPDTKP